MFIIALFIIARTWKQPRCPSADEWTKICGTYTQWNITQLLKRIHLNQFNEVDETGAYYTEWSKPRSKTPISILMHIYMKFRKMVRITLYVRQQMRHRCIEQFFGLCGRMRGWDDLGE